MIAGVIWTFVYLAGINWFVQMGVSVPLTMLIVVGVITGVVCALHLIVTANTWFNKLPMMFGTIAVLFYTNGQDLLTVTATLTGGLIVGLLCTVGTNWLAKALIKDQA